MAVNGINVGSKVGIYLSDPRGYKFQLSFERDLLRTHIDKLKQTACSLHLEVKKTPMTFKLHLLGPPKSGLTSLLRKSTDQIKQRKDLPPSLSFLFSKKEYVSLCLLDSRDIGQMTDFDCLLFVFDLSEESSLEDLAKYESLVESERQNPNRKTRMSTYLVGTKRDLAT